MLQDSQAFQQTVASRYFSHPVNQAHPVNPVSLFDGVIQGIGTFFQSPRMMASRISLAPFPSRFSLSARRTSLRQTCQPAE